MPNKFCSDGKNISILNTGKEVKVNFFTRIYSKG